MALLGADGGEEEEEGVALSEGGAGRGGVWGGGDGLMFSGGGVGFSFSRGGDGFSFSRGGYCRRLVDQMASSESGPSPGGGGDGLSR